MSFLVLAVLAKHFFIMFSVLHFSWDIALQDALFSTLVLSLAAWGMLLLIRAYPTTAAVTLYALFVALFASGVTALLQYKVLKWWMGDTRYIAWLYDTLPVRFLVIWIFNTWMATISAFRKNVAALDARFQKQADAATLLKEAELFKLRQQLQPHFLYNSLNSINALIMISPDKAQEMVGKLSDFLRSSVRRENEENIAVADELTYIRSYLAIESIRFGDRLHVAITQTDTDHARIPPFLLQPILENAIKFGLYGNTGKVTISLSISLQVGMLTISVTNPFDADMQPPRGTGFGLTGIRRRLYLLYARNDLLETVAETNQFTTILKIPQ